MHWLDNSIYKYINIERKSILYKIDNETALRYLDITFDLMDQGGMTILLVLSVLK